MAGIPFPPFNKEVVQQFVESASKLMPSEQSREELHQQLQILMQGALSKMDLLTREEFDAQTAVLHRMQERIAQLESQLAALTEKVDKQA
ncbi:MAG: accessory factor UbiK family protein [Cellvibrionales bacterium]|nr:accessory factor UbiK family protein [Cellvibrionales bacterium]